MIDALLTSLKLGGSRDGSSRVQTTTLLPSGALAAVQVTSTGSNRYLVSDAGAAWQDLLSLGLGELTASDRRRGTLIAAKLGIMFDNDSTFSLRDVSSDQLAAAIVFVAEGARDWAQKTSEHAVRRTEAALSHRVEERLKRLLPQVKLEKERELTGASTKKYRFDLVARLPNDRNAVFEIVSSNPNSLSSTHLKLFDLMTAHPDWPREVITDQLWEWDRADINLLAGVSTHVRGLDQDWEDLRALVH